MADPREPRGFEQQASERKKSPSSTKCKRFSTADYLHKKRRPFGLKCKGDNDIFITNKTNFKAQLGKCEKLFDSGASQIIIHALGAAVYRASTLALQLKELHCGGVDLDVKTSTVPIIDDFVPLTDEADYEVNKRQNSAVHIRVFRTFTLSGLKYQQ